MLICINIININLRCVCLLSNNMNQEHIQLAYNCFCVSTYLCAQQCHKIQEILSWLLSRDDLTQSCSLQFLHKIAAEITALSCHINSRYAFVI